MSTSYEISLYKKQIEFLKAEIDLLADQITKLETMRNQLYNHCPLKDSCFGVEYDASIV